MPDSIEARIAVRAVNRWKTARKFSEYFPKAIQLFDALVNGDVDLFNKLLKQYFPMFTPVVAGQPAYPQAVDFSSVRADLGVISSESLSMAVALDGAADEFGLIGMDF